MAIPVAITTITVQRRAASGRYDEPYGGGSLETVAAGVPAVIDTPTSGAHGGSQRLGGGEQTVTALRLFCDNCGLQAEDYVTDDTSGLDYRVTWCMTYDDDSAGCAHTQGELERVEGLV